VRDGVHAGQRMQQLADLLGVRMTMFLGKADRPRGKQSRAVFSFNPSVAILVVCIPGANPTIVSYSYNAGVVCNSTHFFVLIVTWRRCFCFQRHLERSKKSKLFDKTLNKMFRIFDQIFFTK
jgi:hypothetical protein